MKVMLPGDFNTNRKLSPGLFSNIRGKYRAQDERARAFTSLVTPTTETLKTAMGVSGQEVAKCTSTVLVPHELGPWWWPSSPPPSRQQLPSKMIVKEASIWSVMAEGAEAEVAAAAEEATA